MGVGDAYDIGWKLAAVLKGHGGPYLLDSYELERRPVALRNVERSGKHQSVHWEYCKWVKQQGAETVLSSSEEGTALKRKIEAYVMEHDGENKDHGIEMGYRHNGSPVVLVDKDEKEPEWSVRDYIPSTWPGSRAPHLFLESDPKTSIFDLYGPDYTIVDFTSDAAQSVQFCIVAERLNIPLKQVSLPSEPHVRKIWERDLVLIRPDGFVAWRSRLGNPNLDDATIENVLLIALGQVCSPSCARPHTGQPHLNGSTKYQEVKEQGFTATVGNVEQDAGKIQKLGAFQT